MQLIGMLDSPYVRRTAISMLRLGLKFEHRSISVFRTFDQFLKINPVVKAPTLICDDGEVLMDSTLIIDYAEALAGGGRSLMPAALDARKHALRLLGLALAACEKSVQIVYERNRPTEMQHQPWVTRVQGQMLAAYQALEAEFRKAPPASGAQIDQAGITCAVAWHFTQMNMSELVPPGNYPALAAYSAAAEQLPVFLAVPYGAGTVDPRAAG